MKGTRVLSYALLSLVVGASTAVYAQGEKGKKPDQPTAVKQGDKGKKSDSPAAAKQGEQRQRVEPPPGQGKKQAPPAHAQPAPQRQRPQAASPDRGKPSPRPTTQPATQRQRVQQPSPTRARTPAPAPAQARRPAPPAVLPAAVQRQRTQTEQQRATQYRQRLDQQVRFSQQQAAQLQQQKRANQYRAQQLYLAQLRQQQLRLQTARNYSNDPYIRTAPSYRYVYSGTTRETNQYGVDVLRQAVNYGYQQGVRFGQADRQDGWPANYQNSAAYRDANYGYSGYYVDQADYNYYFRQGFQRGYADGYNSQSQYGTSLNGTSSILATLLSSILGLTSLR